MFHLLTSFSRMKAYFVTAAYFVTITLLALATACTPTKPQARPVYAQQHQLAPHDARTKHAEPYAVR